MVWYRLVFDLRFFSLFFLLSSFLAKVWADKNQLNAFTKSHIKECHYSDEMRAKIDKCKLSMHWMIECFSKMQSVTLANCLATISPCNWFSMRYIRCLHHASPCNNVTQNNFMCLCVCVCAWTMTHSAAHSPYVWMCHKTSNKITAQHMNKTNEKNREKSFPCFNQLYRLDCSEPQPIPIY